MKPAPGPKARPVAAPPRPKSFAATPTASQVGAAAEPLGLALTDPALDRLAAYLALIQRWNAVYNLTAVRHPAAMLSQHLLDCLAVIPSFDRVLGAGPAADAPAADPPAPPRILDVGSGAGLPGVVLAIVRPLWTIHCVDAVAKKAAFLRQVAGELQLDNLRAVHARIEDYPERDFPLITSRAFAALGDFTSWTASQLRTGGCWAALKGLAPHDEIQQLDPSIEVFHVEPLMVPTLDAARCIVWMRHRPKPA